MQTSGPWLFKLPQPEVQGLESNLNSYLLSFNKSGGYLNSFSASFIFKWTAFLLK